MKLIIDIPEEVYKLGALGLYFDCYSMRLHDTILSGTPIPEKATNGEVLKIMFKPNRITRTDDNTVHMEYDFTPDWWDAPYQKGGKGCHIV